MQVTGEPGPEDRAPMQYFQFAVCNAACFGSSLVAFPARVQLLFTFEPGCFNFSGALGILDRIQ